jgi:FAD/FMN-containing dehydrogenase
MAEDVIQQLASRFAEKDLLTDQDSFQIYGQDWTRFYEVAPTAIVFPRTEDDLVWLVEQARKNNWQLVPSGGRTGLSAGATASHGEIVVAMDRMDQILDFDQASATVVCQAGVITEQLQQFAERNGLFYGVDFAASGSSQIGGNVATNAGGIRVLRYGMTRQQVLGLKVVTGTGEILNLNRGLLKNATGLDFRHLFIGSEGILGFITEVTIQLLPPPAEQSVLVLGLAALEDVMSVMETFRKKMTLSAYEFFSHQAMQKVIEHQDANPPFETEAPFYALLEVDMGQADSEQLLMECFEAVMEQGWVIDGAMSQSASQAESLWMLREGISESITPYTPYKNDVSVTPANVPAFLRAVDERVSEAYPDFECIWFGHIGDGNLHLNMLKPETLSIEEFKAQCVECTPLIYAQVEAFGGSISAEHGIGLLKKDSLHYSRSEQEIALMKQVKQVFDPDNIMNPGKVIDL